MPVIGLDTPVRFLRGIGPKRADILAQLNIFTLLDLLEHYPRRYEDRSNCTLIAQLEQGSYETVIGSVIRIEEKKPRPRMTLTKLFINDHSGMLAAVWFNQSYIKKQYPVGSKVAVYGKVNRNYCCPEMNTPEIEPLEGLYSGKIVPVYALTEGISQQQLRSLIKQVINNYSEFIVDPLPESVRQRFHLFDKCQALSAIHFPDTWQACKQARQRLAFEELFILQYGLAAIRSQYVQDNRGIVHCSNGELIRRFMNKLPFTLTTDQIQATENIFHDMESNEPMNRLLQGDVGSGKTIVAAAALVKTVENGYQGVLMAPTEILAEQHFSDLTELLEPLGIKTLLLTGSLGRRERQQVLARIADGDVMVAIGTHALLQEQVIFRNLGLVVTDEQHRFGVEQRLQLQKKGRCPDVLVMTATPIPRTLALTVYGDLNFSMIRQLPPGRKPIRTYFVNSTMRFRLNQFVRNLVEQGQQVYIVCPLITESDKIEAQAAEQYTDYISKQIFPDLRVEMLHGKMKREIKESVMQRFSSGQIDILVATSVIEVGVNVPNASLIIIEGAERFGLAQLHQLRGRVGRGRHQSYCVLVSDSDQDEVQKRLRLMTQVNDGFLLAEKDLELRGPGDFVGTRQHGLPQLKIADLIADRELLEQAYRCAVDLLQNSVTTSALRQLLMTKFAAEYRYVFVG